MSVTARFPAQHGESKTHTQIQINKIYSLNSGDSASMSETARFEDMDELSRLKALATGVREQDDLERDVGRQVFETFELT